MRFTHGICDDPHHPEGWQEKTYAAHIAEMRRYYMTHVPKGMNKKQIERMSARQIEEMDDILSE